MANYRTVNETARLWGVKDTQVTRYCRDGRIDGAVKIKGSWMIPEEAQKPAWGKKSELAAKSTELRRPLPVGVSSYKEACSNYYYIDKTMLIKDFLDERPKVALFTRPRRFGKTLNMDMLRTFFEMSADDTSVFFRDKLIWQQGEAYRAVQGQYPVIYLSFKDVKYGTWEETFAAIRSLISDEAQRHIELRSGEKCSRFDKESLEELLSGKAGKVKLAMSLQNLSRMLHEHYGVAPIIIIDEYDTPIQQGYAKGFYDDTVDFMRNLFSGAFKDNDHLTYGFLTGILRVAKESIFSGLNNLKIYSILDDRFSRYFGFTADEVRQMAQYYRAEDKITEICSWYDGYRFGDTDIFNPWSVINYFSNDCKPRPFWENTGSNTIIGEILESAGEDIYSQLNAMLQGKEITTLVDTNVIYPEIRNNPSSIYSFLLVAGYLKLAKLDMSSSGDFMCRVSLPNREIAYVYKKEVIGRLSCIVPQAVSVSIQEALYLGDAEALQRHIRRFLLESVSSFDLVNENAYHMLVLSLCAIMSDKYYLTSNRESGEGRYDIQLMPKDLSMPGIIIEMKHRKDCLSNQLEVLAAEAISQINEKQYDTEMRQRGVKNVAKYGVAFSGKNVTILKE